jgi:hypothetical protein
MIETDKQFLDRIEGYEGPKEKWVPMTIRLFALARHGVEAADRIEQLEAALRPLACTCEVRHQVDCSRSEVDCRFWNARAALEDRT